MTYIIVILTAGMVFSLLHTSHDYHLTLLVDAWIVIPLYIVTISLTNRIGLIIVFIISIINLLLSASFVGFDYVYIGTSFSKHIYLLAIIKLELMYYSISFLMLFLYNKPIMKLLKSIPDVVSTIRDESNKMLAIKEEKHNLDGVVNVVAQIQLSLRPDNELFELIPNYNISGINIPYDKISGDFYEVFYNNDKINIAFGDVTGHGIDTSIIMLIAQSCIKTGFYNNSRLIDIIDILNKLLYQNIKLSKNIQDKRNLVINVANIKDNVFTVCGKHENILIYKDNDIINIDTTSFGPTLGVYPKIKKDIKCKNIPIEIGNRIIFFSDGLTEAVNSYNSEYGLKNIITMFKESIKLSTEDQVEHIYASVLSFIDPIKLSDDFSMLILERIK